MGKGKIFDFSSYIIAFVTFAISLFFIYNKTHMFFDSVIVALLSAGMVWLTYITIRACILAGRKDR
ncbi:MAG: hypothetical protein VX777_03610 [Chlamydiota bacterium]|nr:hypothetical protein [Chlamydiota bacterium]